MGERAVKIFFIAFGLLLVGCGSKSERPRVRIAIPGTGLQTFVMPIALASELGYYKDEGLDVAIEHLPSSVKALQALLGGSVDVAGLVFSFNIQMAAEGQRVRSFFVVNNRDSKVLIVAPSANNRIHRIEDLKGALVGASAAGTAAQLWVSYLLGKHGLQEPEYSTVAIGIGAPAFAAIEDGRVAAAALAGGDHFHLLKRHPDLRILADNSTVEGMRKTYGGDFFAGGTLSAKQDWLDRNPQTARQLAKALARTHQWILTHTAEEIREKVPEAFRSQDAAVDIQILRWSLATFTTDGRMPKGAPEAWKRVLDATVESVRTAKIDLAATWTDEYLPGTK